MERKYNRSWQQNILWREWRNCADTMLARHLFELVADAPVGWGTRLAMVVLNMMVGMTTGLIIGFVLTSNWLILQQIMGAGGIVGLVRGFLVGRHLSWRDWIDRLAFNLPTEEPSSGLGAFVGLSLLGGLVFGPYALLVLVGLFWGLGGMIQWVNKDQSAQLDPFGYHAWYIWWPVRPSPTEVDAALDQFFQADPSARLQWTEAMQALEEEREAARLVEDV
jgi:hypothetical protein